MDAERFDSRTERSQVMEIEDEMEDNGDERSKESSRYRTRDRDKSSRRDEKDHRSKERDRDVRDERVSSRDRRKDEKDEREKDWRKDYREERDKHRDRDREQERERERDRDRKDRAKERDREIDKEIDHRTRDKERGKEDRSKDKGGREKERDRVKEKEREKHREKERDRDGEKERDRERATKKGDEVDHHDREKDHRIKLDSEQGSAVAGREQNSESASDGARISTSEFEERILKAKEERAKKKSESASEVMEWVSRSRKLDEKRNSEKEKAAQLARIFEEQDNIGEEGSEDEEEARQTSHHLAGVKVLHGLDKVIEGGAVVLTLKDQDILANGDINEEVDMLENVEIGEQKRRDEAYKASKKKTGVYDDKFNDDTASEKKMLPQYDDPVTDEGVTLDARGRLTGAAEKKLEELRRRLEGASTGSRSEDLTSTSRVSLDYYTQEEMIQFKKPKKKKSLRKKEKLDLDALEAEAVSSGLGAGDLGSRSDVRRQAIREEQERLEAEKRNNAYQTAYAKAEEASKLLRMEQTLPVKTEEEENVILDNDEDFYKSLERARKLALKKQKEDEASGPKAIALLAATTPSIQTAADENQSAGEGENRVVITEMEEFVWGLQLNEESRKPDSEDVFMDEDEAPVAPDNEQKDEGHGWIEVDEPRNDNNPLNNDEEEIAPDETIHEAAVGKGLSGALKLLKERGTLKETIEWGGRNMDKKKSKLVGIADEEGPKEIRIERRDEFGRILTPKEAFRSLSHKFHGKGPGKKKQEKRMKQYQEELKLKQMKNADTPSLSAERMREAQAQMKTPYLVLSGHVKPGQNSDPRSAFATIEKDTGSLTPMLGDRKVEHFLGIKRKPDSENMGPLKKPKT